MIEHKIVSREKFHFHAPLYTFLRNIPGMYFLPVNGAKTWKRQRQAVNYKKNNVMAI